MKSGFLGGKQGVNETPVGGHDVSDSKMARGGGQDVIDSVEVAEEAWKQIQKFNVKRHHVKRYIGT